MGAITSSPNIVEAKNCQPGSRVRYLNGDIDAWFVGHYDNKHFLGWKQNESIVSGVKATSVFFPWRVIYADIKAKVLLAQYSCIYGWSIGYDEKLAVLLPLSVNNTSNSLNKRFDGLHCKRCENFFPMAVPNRPDGVSLICFSCRQGWLPAGM